MRYITRRNHGWRRSAPRGLGRREFIEASAAAALYGLSGVGGVSAFATPPQGARRQAQRAVPESAKADVARDDKWYQAFTGVAVSKGALVCSYLKTDQHLRTTTDIMIARSEDGGRTWKDHRSLSHLDVERDGAIWVAPELNRLRDGRLVLICDKGARKPGQELPMLSQWQTKERGMWNWIFIERRRRRTWRGRRKTDDVGGEPERIHELSNGAWVYTRTDSRPTAAMKKPVEPWGANYYRSTAVFSDDQGKTWGRSATAFDDPLYGDCEVGICEYAPGKLLAISRCGDAGSAQRPAEPFRLQQRLRQDVERNRCSRHLRSPPDPGSIQVGQGARHFPQHVGHDRQLRVRLRPGEKFVYQPNSFIWDETRCQLKEGAMEIRSAEGTRRAVSSRSTRSRTTTRRSRWRPIGRQRG